MQIEENQNPFSLVTDFEGNNQAYLKLKLKRHCRYISRQKEFT